MTSTLQSASRDFLAAYDALLGREGRYEFYAETERLRCALSFPNAPDFRSLLEELIASLFQSFINTERPDQLTRVKIAMLAAMAALEEK
jgi:hypothetical protein